jgi:hypothetical protein
MRRRALLGSALAAAAATACGRDAVPAPTVGFASTVRGVVVLRADSGEVGEPAPVALATADWAWVVTAEPAGPDTRVMSRAATGGRQRWQGVLAGSLRPQATSTDGRCLALVAAPSPSIVDSLHNPAVVPAARDRTTVVVADGGTERARLDLPGNLLPDSFSADASRLYAYEFAEPHRARLRTIDVAAGRLLPPSGGELHGYWRSAVHGADRRYALFVYPAAGRASVLGLRLRDGSSQVAALPAPFGGARPGVHELVWSPDGRRLCAVYNPDGTVVDLDPDTLAVRRIGRFGSGLPGKPGAVLTPRGRLVVSGDAAVVATDPDLRISTPGESRGLAVVADAEAWVGHPGGVVRYDLADGQELGHFPIPGMLTLQHAH